MSLCIRLIRAIENQLQSKYSLASLVLSIFLIANLVYALPQTFVTESQLNETTSQIKFRIKRPRPDKGTTLQKNLLIKGCWLHDGFKSIQATDKNKKKVRFKFTADKSALTFKKIKTIKYPISVTLNLTEERAVISRASAVIASGSTKCQQVKNKKGQIKLDCSASTPVSKLATFSGVACNQPSDFKERVSLGKPVLADGDIYTIRSINSPLRFAMQNANFSDNLSDFSVILNGETFFAPEIVLSSGILTLNKLARDGKNTVTISAIDSDGYQAVNTFSFWAGQNELNLIFQDLNKKPTPSGQVSLAIGDDPLVKVEQLFSNGKTILKNIPNVTVSISAKGNDASSGFVATAGNSQNTIVTMLNFSEPSTINNNDISQGTAGWNTPDTNSLSVIAHTEDSPLPAAALSQRDNTVDNDIVLHTAGKEGTRFMTRTFKTDPKTRLVRIRYRFQTSEYPGGFFGSKYNDFYNVSLRSSKGASIIDDGSSMNALGEAAFNAAGFTAWKSTVIPVNRNPQVKDPEIVQATVAVANIADGAYDSQVVVDKIEESPFAITQAELLDIDNTPLNYISLHKHNYFQGFTWINGTITLEGESDDQINYIYLQLMNDGKEVAAAEISSQASSKLYNRKFGKTKKLQIKTPMLLFKVFPNVLDELNTNSFRNFSLVIQATSKNGHKAHTTLPNPVTQLVLFTGQSRYDGRDPEEGGDDWLQPHVREAVNEMSGITWGDFSNMNGGNFIGHERHRDGRAADGWFAGYNALDAQTAQNLIDLLDTPSGNRIRFIYVAFNRHPGNAFYQAIRGRTLKNGRKVENVILPDAQHRTHFHVEF